MKKFCTKCGAKFPDGASGCPVCSGSETGSEDSGPEPDYPVTTWSRKIPLITNYILIRDFFLMFAGLGFLVATILVIVTWDPELYVLLGVVFAAVFLLCLLIMLVLQVAYGGGLNATYFISQVGVAHAAGKEIQALDRLSLFGNAAGGSTAGTGAGLIAVSQENNLLSWKEVRYVRVYSRLRFIELRSKYLISPVVLYCTEENFPAVLEMVKQYAPKTASVRIK